MKKIILILSLLVFAQCVYAAPDATVKRAIKKYKAQNYTGCMQDLSEHIKDNPSALAYYYLGMSYTQAGRQEQAVEAYDNAIKYAVEEKNDTIKKYAQIGKDKVVSPEVYENPASYEEIDTLLKDKSQFPNEIKVDFKKKHLEYLRNEINADRPTGF